MSIPSELLQTKIGSSHVIKDDIIYVMKYLENQMFHTIFFDPPFRNVMAKQGMLDNEYSVYIEHLTNCALNRFNHKGQIISMNYIDAIDIVDKTLKKNGLKCTYFIEVPVNDRNENRTKSDISKKLYITIHSNDGSNEHIEWNEVKHKPGVKWKEGEKSITDAPQTWLIERIFHLVGKDNIVNVLDMFGGSGNVPHFCKTFNIPCISSENDIARYFSIVKRLSQPKPDKKCKLALCNKKFSGIGFCSSHYAKAYKNQNEEVFLGLDINFNAITSKNYKKKESKEIKKFDTIDTLKQLLGYSNIATEKAKYESNSGTTNRMEGSVQGHSNHGEQETKEEEAD